jgi:GT2 family glycosyltransferase
VIIVVWNGEHYLAKCLDAVVSQKSSDDEVIVVDNGSVDNSVVIVREQYPEVKIIENRRNLGFAGGVNTGIKAARGKFLFLLNQDTIMHHGWLDALLGAFNEERTGIVGCKLLYPDGRVQHAGGLIHWPLGLPDHFGYGQPDDGRWDKPRLVDYVTGAAFGIRRSVVEQIGPFDERFWPGYYEEVDYCLRARQAGWEVVYIPWCVGTHLESASLGKGSKPYLEAMHRGRLRFVLKHLDNVRLMNEFLPAERKYLLDSPPLLRQALRHAYYTTMICTVPEILEDIETTKQLILGFSHLYSLSLEGEMAVKGSGSMHNLPLLEEFSFPSKMPVIGSLVSLIRRFLYSLTAKWAVWFLIQQQNQINQIVENWLREQESMLIDLDRDLALLARTVAEIEIRQRYLAKSVEANRAADQTKRDA